MIANRCFQLIDLQDELGGIALVHLEIGFGDPEALLGALELFKDITRFAIASLCDSGIGFRVQPRDFLPQGVDLRFEFVFVVERIIDALAQLRHLTLQVRRALKTRQARQVVQGIIEPCACQGIQFTEEIVH